MDISRELAIEVLQYLAENKGFYFPFLVMNKEYSDEDEDFVEIEASEWATIDADENYQTFQLWENLQNLDKSTVQLMAKGFIAKITGDSLELRIAELAKNYRSEWKKELWKGEKIEGYRLKGLIAGKAEAYKDCLELIEAHSK